MPTQVNIRLTVPFNISQNYADHVSRLLASGWNGWTFLGILNFQLLATLHFLIFFVEFSSIRDFPVAKGLPMYFGYVYAFGLFISWIGLLYVFVGFALGALYLPSDIHAMPHGGRVFHCRVYPYQHPLAPVRNARVWSKADLVKVMTVDLGRVLYLLVLYLSLGIVIWRRSKWSSLSPELRIDWAVLGSLILDSMAIWDYMKTLKPSWTTDGTR